MQKTIYITQAPVATMVPEHPSQASGFPSIDVAVAAFSAMPVTLRLRRMAVLEVSSDVRLAITDYPLK
jgi:hypothetical protein